MNIDRQLTMFRCQLNSVNIKTSMKSLAAQELILERCLKQPDFKLVKASLDLAMQDVEYIGFKSELNNMLRMDEKLRGHDYLKMWLKTFFVMKYEANFIIADTASHHMLQNVCSYEQKNELLNMMRGRKSDIRVSV